MWDPRVVAGNEAVPREIFTGDTARMSAATIEELTAVPCEVMAGETARIDQTALTGLIEKSEGVAIGTPKDGVPQLADIEVVESRPPVLPVMRASRRRDVMIGGALAIVVALAWYCALQL